MTMDKISRSFWIMITTVVILCNRGVQTYDYAPYDDSYEALYELTDHLLGPNSSYNANLRPLDDQSEQMVVNLVFSVVSLEEIDDVKQSFTINGFLCMDWYDERIYWDYSEYALDYLHPRPTEIWRPRMIVLNTLGERDMFKDNYSPLVVDPNGFVWWMAGGIFKGSCFLDMSRYPFDQQSCHLLFCPIGYASYHLLLVARMEHFNFDFFVSNEEWDITKTTVEITPNVEVATYANVTCVKLIIDVKRRSSYYVLNLILPVLLLSFLNSFVFLIPDESGEKIGYGITVLLSVSVFLTTVSSMIPRASHNVPAVTIYLFVLLSFSVVSVLASIATVFLHHADEDETDHLQAQAKYNQAVTKVSGVRQAFVKVERLRKHRNPNVSPSSTTPVLDFEDSSPSSDQPKNKYRAVTKHINKICFVCSLSFWIITQAVYFVYVTA